MNDFIAQLAGWDSFYLIVGSAAGALIGLQFVVLTLLAQKPLPRGAAETGAAFTTPTIFHFGVALVLSALLRAPWESVEILSVILCVIGLGGVSYMGTVALRMRKGKGYRPGLEDWLFHIVLPILAYAILALPLFMGVSHLREALFGVGAATLVLLLVGIHNAWDNCAYTLYVPNLGQEESEVKEMACTNAAVSDRRS